MSFILSPSLDPNYLKKNMKYTMTSKIDYDQKQCNKGRGMRPNIKGQNAKGGRRNLKGGGGV